MIKTKKKTIFIANKLPEKIKSARLILQHLPYTILTTSSKKNYINIIKTQTHINLILLDINLISNETNNIFIQSLKINPKLKIIITAKHKISTIFQKNILFNAYGIILKPFDINELLTTIKEAIEITP